MAWVVPDIIIVGYGRSQTIQIKCLNCGSLYFPDEKFHYLCEICVDDEIKIEIEKWRTVEAEGTLNVIDQIQKTNIVSGYKGRSRKNYNKVYKRDNYTCQYCGFNLSKDELLPLHIDHVTPFSFGGNYSMENLVVACSQCNLIASDKVFTDFEHKKEHILRKRKQRGYKIYNNEPQIKPVEQRTPSSVPEFELKEKTKVNPVDALTLSEDANLERYCECKVGLDVPQCKKSLNKYRINCRIHEHCRSFYNKRLMQERKAREHSIYKNKLRAAARNHYLKHPFILLDATLIAEQFIEDGFTEYGFAGIWIHLRCRYKRDGMKVSMPNNYIPFYTDLIRSQSEELFEFFHTHTRKKT